MAIDLKALAKLAGISESELKGLSAKEQVKLISKRVSSETEKLEIEEAKVYISNYEKHLPKLKEQLKEPFQIYVKSVGQKKSPTIVPVVGYNGTTKEVIVFQNGKLHPMKEDELITSIEELSTIIGTKRPRAPKGSNTTGNKKTK